MIKVAHRIILNQINDVKKIEKVIETLYNVVIIKIKINSIQYH